MDHNQLTKKRRQEEKTCMYVGSVLEVDGGWGAGGGGCMRMYKKLRFEMHFHITPLLHCG